MKILVTGGIGFIGSHIAEYHAAKGDEVVVIDNLSRGTLLGKPVFNYDYTINHLAEYKNIRFVKADIRDFKVLSEAAAGCDLIFHAASQTAVTASLLNPAEDFTSNVVGTFNVLEAARTNGVGTVVYCSTNKVYGNNVNNVGIVENSTRYVFEDAYRNGIPETFPIDRCEHTPYGCSKLSGDIYCQEYAHRYGIRTCNLRMSCIYGTRQFGVEDQGWVAWLVYATLRGLPITIYGDGKQIRDLLFISDLVDLYARFLVSEIPNGVFNVGGGREFTVSIIELLDILYNVTGKRSAVTFAEWRHSDQKAYVSDIGKASTELQWQPQISPREGIDRLVSFISGCSLLEGIDASLPGKH
ncbi:MAG: NAD-dependent epimerase/dehydratase family protein [Geobacteraceae bacterium]|nr:NAD-dependent epimerase/dehydratase family protein [Geobacteraceae bacterium]